MLGLILTAVYLVGRLAIWLGHIDLQALKRSKPDSLLVSATQDV